MSSHETFAARWARRKREALAEGRDGREPGKQPAAVTAETTGESGASAPDAPLPSLDDITPEGNISAFLEKRIPAELQKMALRKAWALDPVISGFIEMAENQYDWNVPGGAPGYGPLDAGEDLEFLLAQATGMLPPVDATGSDDVTHVANNCGVLPHSAQADVDLVQDDVDLALQQPSQRPEAPQPTEDFPRTKTAAQHGELSGEAPTAAGVAQEKTQRLASHNSQAAHRRRHGGALPS